MEKNAQWELAHHFLCYTGTNLFLTGKAGTGKTTFLRRLKTMSPKRMIVVAPTGVAAINAGGVTIHSFFQLPFGPYVPGKSTAVRKNAGGFSNKFSREKINIIRSLDLLVIDEISMVRADLLDAVSDLLCRYRGEDRPFGGVQLLLIGDLQQLAPVVKEEEWELLKEVYTSPFFFDSVALRQTRYVSIELTHVYRQTDEAFIHLLNKIRDNRVDETVISALNRRYIPDFKPSEEEGYIVLTTHNAQAQLINTRKLEEIAEKAYTFPSQVEGDFPAYLFPTEERLVLKKGAQVMFVKNDSSAEKRYYNGKIGRVVSIGTDSIQVHCSGDSKPISVNREEWLNTRYAIHPETKEIRETVEGKFVQYPLKTAWAITIHKSQGLTFERAVIDVGAAFTHGQVYVALSRCKSLEGLVLSSPLKSGAVIHDRMVRSFIRQVEQNQPGKEELEEEKKRYYIQLVTELFDFVAVWKSMQRVAWIYGKHLYRLYPELSRFYREMREEIQEKLAEVGERFKMQLQRLLLASDNYEKDEVVKERIGKGVIYFREETEKLHRAVCEAAYPEIDNKEVRKQLEEAMTRLLQEIHVKIRILESAGEGFSPVAYLKSRAEAVLDKAVLPGQKHQEKINVSADILHPALYRKLCEWRKKQADRLKLPVYTVLQQKALLGICNTLPADGRELLKIPGIGKKVIEKYGSSLLEIVDGFRGIKLE